MGKEVDFGVSTPSICISNPRDDAMKDPTVGHPDLRGERDRETELELITDN